MKNKIQKELELFVDSLMWNRKIDDFSILKDKTELELIANVVKVK
jgi:hypothetical protein